jgi:hypothetical protein
MHNPYEELCALAITGQVTDSERALLDEHMRECEECRTLIEHLHPEVSRLAPAMAELLRVDAAPPEGMRERFLRRASVEGLNITAGTELPQSVAIQARARDGLGERFGVWWRSLFAHDRSLGFWAVAAGLLIVGVVGSHMLLVQREQPGHEQIRREDVSAAVMHAEPTKAVEVLKPVQAASVSPQEEGLRTEMAAITQRLELATAKAAELEASNAQLQHSLAAASQQAELTAAERDAQRAASQASNAQVAALRQQLDDAKSKMVTLDAVAAAQERQTSDAEARVASMKAEMDQMYAARGTAEAMISARNLHIIDVYDDTGRGAKQGAFGRVFYVEGKSLVFYAYDLPNPKRDKNFSFQLWGEGQGLEPTTYKLGLLRPDTTGHGRWVVACDDPKILGQLRGVFIAPASPKGDPPSPSQKLMYAMLGSANHP